VYSFAPLGGFQAGCPSTLNSDQVVPLILDCKLQQTHEDDPEPEVISPLVSEEIRVCSVLELGGMEWNGSIPAVWNGSMPVFGSDKNEEWNGSIFCSVLELHDGTEQPKHNFFLQIKINRGKKRKKSSKCSRGGRQAATGRRRPASPAVVATLAWP
jgi:hypothetical protein